VIFYLHGFASSARSSKAAYFAAKFRRHGIDLQIPDFNEPDFSTLTITGMVDRVCAAIDASFDSHAGRSLGTAGAPEPATLIGSSLGAFVAVQVALKRAERLDRLILLAPALDFGGNRMRALGDRGLEEWKRTNTLNVFHYGFNRVMPVHYELYADAGRYDCVSAALSMPIQIFQGRNDDAVDPAAVERWAQARPNVELHMLDDDHQLTASLDFIWAEVERFLRL
jgi:pimeloyl-ACP methyl ester carboxylesterase